MKANIYKIDIGIHMAWISGMKPKNWRQTEQNGINTRPNASIWMWDEPRC